MPIRAFILPLLVGPLLVALLLAGAGSCKAAGRPGEEGREAEARELLEKAEEGAKRGQYRKAWNTFKLLSKEYADTPAGQRAASRAGESGFLCASDLLRHGPSRNRVDVVVMGEGFTLDQQDDFDTLSKVVLRNFPRSEVFEEYFAYHNFIRANLHSAESGVDGHNRTYDTALDARLSGGIQGQVAVSRQRVHAMLAELPEHDQLAIAFVKNGNLGTGGGGVASVGGRSPKTMIHEWGHAFASLMDEYSSNTGHRGQVENGPNVARTEDPDQVPWKHWLERRVSGVGIYQGAAGRPQGAWKPTNNCIMDVGVDFCPICREAIVLEIYRLVDPIEGCRPAPHDASSDPITIDMTRSVRELEPVEFQVEILTPASHGLLVCWWVLPEEQAPPFSELDLDRSSKDRRVRGPLRPIEERPRQRSHRTGQRSVSFEVDPRDFDPGRYLVVCRVTDTARPRGAKVPWVLSDPAGVLQAERSWRLHLQQ